ncbi:iron ABC transporter permease [Pseudonocardia ailaonensis]|uniref:Iron ABC transporter permease n=1 Tax=Pseudonocardia ailaonensis TaxID=367279 RepID=A0ABN2MUQ4_9PSEU
MSVTGAGVRRQPTGWPWLALAVLLALLVVWPLARLLGQVFGDGLDAFRRLADYPGLGAAYVNTLVISLGGVALALVAGTGLAWCTTRVPPRLRTLVAAAPVLPLVMPSVASVEGWQYLLAPRTGLLNRTLRDLGLGSGAAGPLDIQSLPGIVLLSGSILTSFVYLFVTASLRQRGAELEAAAAACGAGPWRTFLTVTLPMLRPALVYSGVITFLLALGQFTVPLLLGGPRRIEVVSTVIYRVSAEYPVDYGLGGAVALPLLVIGVGLVAVQRRALRDEQRYVAVSGRTRQVGIRTSWWACVPVLGYLVVAVVLPLFALIVVSLSPYWSGQVNPSVFTTDNWVQALADPKTTSAISTTAAAVGFTLLLVLPLGYLTALSLIGRTRVPRAVRTGIDLLSSISLCLPAALLGFALLLTYSSPPVRLYGTTAMVVVAYVTLMLPFALRPQLSSLQATGPEYGEASRASGAGPLATALRVTFPLIRNGLGVSAALVTIIVVHEFAVSLLVTSPQRRVIGSLLYDATNSGIAPQVAVLALLMVLLTVAGMTVALLLGGRHSLQRL